MPTRCWSPGGGSTKCRRVRRCDRGCTGSRAGCSRTSGADCSGRTVTPDVAEGITSTVAIRKALENLSDDDRELIQLTTWEGLEPRDVAVVFGVPPRTVRSRLHRARARLREEIGDAFDEYGHVPVEERVQLVQEER